MSRKINITKYEGNTHYSVYVQDSFNQEHHIGYEHVMNNDILAKIEQKACDIWADEVNNAPSLLDKAIAQCVEIDIANGKEPSLD